MKTTLPCVDGEILPQYVARTGKLPALQALAFAGQMLAALDRAHRAGLAYTGFRAGDLVVMLNGQLVLTAWAYAKRGPLQLQPAMDDDLLAAANIAFELMTARPAATRASGSRADWFPPSHAGLPLALDAVFERALSPDAGQRYPTAAAFWQALLTAMGPPVWERQAKPPLVLDEPKARPKRAGQLQPAAPVVRQATPSPARTKPRALFAVAGVAAALVLAVAAGSLVSHRLAPSHEEATVAVASPANADALLDREAPPPREEIVAGSPAVLEPRDSVPAAPPVAAEEQAQPPARLVPATGLEASRPVTAPMNAAPVTRTARAEPPRAAPPKVEQTRSDQQRTAVAARTTVRRTQVAQRGDPNLGCTQEFLITREWCRISKCETAEYAGHPVCKAIRDEQHRRDLVADQALRTR